MKTVLSFSCLLLAVILSAPTRSFAQAATGIPPFGSLSGGPDVVDNANLNAHITIPVMRKAGRGLPFPYALGYDSSVWYPIYVNGVLTWQLANGWEGITQSFSGFITYNTRVVRCIVDVYPRQYDYEYDYDGWTYYDPSGTAHPFGLRVGDGTCGHVTTYSESGAASDGSGYTLSVSATPSATAYSVGGVVINAPLQSTTGAASLVDTNGNEISLSSTNVFTDTLNTNPLTISGSGTPTSPVQLTYTSPTNQPVSIKIKYAAYTVRTNFGCSGVSEFGPAGVYLPSEIDFPDGSFYFFGYEATPGYTGDVTGRLASLAFPTGGSIQYTYTGGNNGIECSDGSAAGLTRQTPDGTWAYTRTTGTSPTTTITDPRGNQTVLTFDSSSKTYETERQIYQGTVAPANLLETITTCYNGATPPNCPGAAVNPPISSLSVYAQLSGGLESETNTLYNSYGLATETDAYGFGNGAPGSLLRKTLTSYASLGNYINNRPSQVTVENGAGATAAQTTYTYDQGTVQSTSGTPQHVSVSGSRGNPTTVSYLTQGSSTLSRTFSYYDTGNVYQANDVNGATTSFNYGACGNSFVTTITLPLNLSSSEAWNCTGGVMTSVTDANSNTTTYIYNDPNDWRIAAVTDPEGNTTNYSYSGAVIMESSMNFNGGSSTVDVLTTLDEMGRPWFVQRRQAPGSSNFDSVQLAYDSLGRRSSVTVPYQVQGTYGCSGCATTTWSYDALGRVTQINDGGGGSQTTSFPQNNNDVLTTLGPAPSGENTKRRQLEYDALGELTSVCEVTGLSGSGTCAQTSSATGYWTKYTFDTLGDLTGVTQNAQSSSTQTRSYSYDGLGRTTGNTTPESGTTTYVYDSDMTCGTYRGDLVKRMDAVGNTTCYAHDSLHRVTSITYGGPYASNTPNKYFVYDSATVNSVAMANAKGRLAEAYTCFSPCSSKITDEGFSYSVRGEVADVYQSTLHSGGYYHVNAAYWAHGALNQLSGLSGLPTITYTVDGEGRFSKVNAASGQNPVSSTSYNVFSEPTQLSLGSLDSDSFTYDGNTGRLTQYKFNVNGQAAVGSLSWNLNGTLGQLSITDAFNSADNQTCNYTHDDLARIGSANCGSVFSGTYTYDVFGNINKTGTFLFQPTYSPTTNQMTQIGGSTPSYDPNGNATNDFLHTYAWDAEGRPVTIDTVGATYDAFGRMAEQSRSGLYTEIAYAPTGDKLALMTGQTLQKAFVPLPAGATAVYNSSGLAYYRHTDWLGSSRLASTPSREIYFDTAYGPFGEPYAQSGTTGLSFTGQNQDTVSALYDFPFREYGIQGRWPSPDPAGLGAVDLSDPQSFNGYAYVRNSPLTLVDPLGLQNNCRQTGDCERHQFTDAVTPWNCDLWGICEEAMTCYVNGFQASCGFTFGLLQQGLAAPCPNNDCSQIQVGANGQWQIFVPGDPGSNCGTSNGVAIICASAGQWVDVQISYPGADAGSAGSGGGWGTFWLQTKVFFQALGNNWEYVKQHDCFTRFVARVAGDQLPTGGPSGGDLVRQGAQTAATTYQMAQGLTTPLRSSIYRGVLSAGGKLAAWYTAADVIKSEWQSLRDEYQEIKEGTCQAW